VRAKYLTSFAFPLSSVTVSVNLSAYPFLTRPVTEPVTEPAFSKPRAS